MAVSCKVGLLSVVILAERQAFAAVINSVLIEVVESIADEESRQCSTLPDRVVDGVVEAALSLIRSRVLDEAIDACILTLVGFGGELSHARRVEAGLTDAVVYRVRGIIMDDTLKDLVREVVESGEAERLMERATVAAVADTTEVEKEKEEGRGEELGTKQTLSLVGGVPKDDRGVLGDKTLPSSSFETVGDAVESSEKGSEESVRGGDYGRTGISGGCDVEDGYRENTEGWLIESSHAPGTEQEEEDGGIGGKGILPATPRSDQDNPEAQKEDDGSKRGEKMLLVKGGNTGAIPLGDLKVDTGAGTRKYISIRQESPRGQGELRTSDLGQGEGRVHLNGSSEENGPVEEGGVILQNPEERAAVMLQSVIRRKCVYREMRMRIARNFVKVYDPDSGYYYWYNQVSDEATWDKPWIVDAYFNKHNVTSKAIEYFSQQDQQYQDLPLVTSSAGT